MPTYRVIDKATGKTVYAYSADAPTPFDGMAFDTHTHIAEVAINENGSINQLPGRRLTKLQFIDRLGDAAYATILQLARTEVTVEAFVKRFEMATPDPDGTSIDLDDPRTAAGVTAIGAALEAMGVVAAGWATSVLA